MYPTYIFWIILLFVSLEAITVNPLCPTNKIAPRRRTVSWDGSESRTFGAFYDLLTPGSPQSNSPLNDLQEKPEEDDPENECGEIEDYDENDLSSVTNQSQRRQGSYSKGNFFDGFFKPPYFGAINRPPPIFLPQKPRPPLRPPFWSGGTFGNNNYRPPLSQQPSGVKKYCQRCHMIWSQDEYYVKPVHENSQQESPVYTPDVVGGVLGNVVGFTPVRPTNRPSTRDVRRRPKYYPSHTTFPPTTVRYNEPPSRELPRPRRLNNNGIFGSFIDLLFK